MNQTALPPMDPVLSLRPEEGLRLLLIGAVCSSFLIPVVILLFYFSDSTVRRRPVFLFKILSVLLGLVEGAVIIHTFSTFVINPTARIPSTLLTAFSSFVYLIPPCVQSVLIFRVISGCSARILSTRTTVAICSPTVALKCIRVTIASVLLARVHYELGGPPASDGASAEAVWKPHATYKQVLWFLQLFDDIYVSSLLIMQSSSCLNRHRTPSRWSSLKLIRTLLATCAIPILLDIVQVAQSFLRLRFAAETYVPLTSGYVQIFWVLLATIWTVKHQKGSTTAAGHDCEVVPGSVTSHLPHLREHRFEELASPSIKDAFPESVRDSSTAVGDDDAEERLKWLAELGKERMHGPTPPSLCTAATFDNTGQPAPVFYAV